MPVSLVIVGKDLKTAQLRSSLYLHYGRFAFLLRKDRSNRQLSELHLCFETKEAVTSCNECSGKRQSHIPGFHFFQYLILFPGILKLCTVFEFKHRVCIVVDTKL